MKNFTVAEIEFIKKNYWNISFKEMEKALKFRHSAKSINAKAYNLGLRKRKQIYKEVISIIKSGPIFKSELQYRFPNLKKAHIGYILRKSDIPIRKIRFRLHGITDTLYFINEHRVYAYDLLQIMYPQYFEKNGRYKKRFILGAQWKKLFTR